MKDYAQQNKIQLDKLHSDVHESDHQHRQNIRRQKESTRNTRKIIFWLINYFQQLLKKPDRK